MRPGAELFFITGADALAQILSWKDPEDALTVAHFIGVTRPGYELSNDHLPDAADDADRRAGHGDLVQRLPRPGPVRAADLVPRARRSRAIHREAPALPGRRAAAVALAADQAG